MSADSTSSADQPLVPDGDERLRDIAGEVAAGRSIAATPRDIMGWFGRDRRTAANLQFVQSKLAQHNLVTSPNLAEVRLESEVAIVRAEGPRDEVDFQLAEADEYLGHSEDPKRVTVRTLLGWFGQSRRGAEVVERVRAALEVYNLETDPDFQSCAIDEVVTLVRRKQRKRVDPITRLPSEHPVPAGQDTSQPSNAFLIGALKERRKELISTNPSATIGEAITLMMLKGVAFLPVVQGKRDARGIVTWRAIAIHLALSDGASIDDQVTKIMTPVKIVERDERVLDVTPHILEQGCVLLADEKRILVDIVTRADLGAGFEKRAQPFFLLDEIEQRLRELIERGEFTPSEMNEVADDPEGRRGVESVHDLTFGEYHRLLSDDDSWNRIGVKLQRKVFLKEIDAVRKIRNSTMHFDPEGLSDEEKKTLLDFYHLLCELTDRGVL